MKTLIAALTLVTLVIGPAFFTSAHAAPRHERGDAAAQNSGGTYHGYPLSESGTGTTAGNAGAMEMRRADAPSRQRTSVLLRRAKQVTQVQS